MSELSIKKDESVKVMVIGLDGATFSILNPLIEQGKLPNLQYLMQEGTSGILSSTVPPSSPPAWSTFACGKEPGKHGIFDFFRNSPEEYNYTSVNSTYLKSKTVWEILSDNNRRAGVVNLLFTYPPKEINGFIVCGKETPGEDREYTFPVSLKKEILELEPKYEAVPFKSISPTKMFLKKVPVDLKCQERVNQHLIKNHPVDFFINLFPMPDIIQHVFWKYMDPGHPLYSRKHSKQFTPLLEKCYQTLDHIVGERIKMVDEDTVIIVMSDHGAGSLNKLVQVNRWLQEQGMMVVKQSYHSRKALFLRKLKGLIKELDNHVAKYDFLGIRKKLKSKTMEKRRAFAKRTIVDWSRTKAYSGRLGEQGIYCNLKGREKNGIVAQGKEYDEVRDFIIAGLSELKDPQTGQKVFSRIYKREELYKGEYLSLAPDIVLDFGDAPYQTADDLLCDRVFQGIKKNGVNGKHRQDGILIAFGKNIKKDAEIKGSCISDLAPTILYLMGEKIPVDMDGRVLTDLFNQSFIESNPARYNEEGKDEKKEDELTYSSEETESIADRLKPLGYL
jgi:predicted AlkP superfamily phosphohydrolase/phosphomutase